MSLSTQSCTKNPLPIVENLAHQPGTTKGYLASQLWRRGRMTKRCYVTIWGWERAEHWWSCSVNPVRLSASPHPSLSLLTCLHVLAFLSLCSPVSHYLPVSCLISFLVCPCTRLSLSSTVPLPLLSCLSLSLLVCLLTCLSPCIFVSSYFCHEPF